MPTQPAILGTARLGNVRLGYVPAALVASRRTRVRVLLGGVDARLRIRGLSVQDTLNDAPNLCRLTIDNATPPTVDETLRLTVGADPPVLLFNGTLQTVDQSFAGTPANIEWPCSAIDDTAAADRRRPFGTWVNVSATTIAQAIVTAFAPHFTTTHIEAALPAVSITFDGSESFIGCLARLATAVGGYCKVEDGGVYLFLDDTADPPDAVDVAHPPEFEPPVTVSLDVSQIRTRVYGKGHSEPLLSDVLVGETLLPVADAVMYGTLAPGGQVIAGTTPDGAASQILHYTSAEIGGGGSLVGPGTQPAAAPGAVVQVGAGLTVGVYQYAYSDVTAAGESLVSPRLYVNVPGFLSAPIVAPTGAPRAGTGITDGTHYYAYTYVTAAGETNIGTISSVVTHGPTVPAPAAIGTAFNSTATTGVLLSPGYTYKWAFTFRRTSDGAETTLSPQTSVVTDAHANAYIPLSGCSAPPAGWTRRWYRTVGNGSTFKVDTYGSESSVVGGVPVFGDYPTLDSDLGATAPTTNVTAVNQTAVSTITPGPSGVIARKLYRTVAGGVTFKLLATIGDNTSTIYTDTTPDGSLGATAPSSNTTVANQVALSGIAAGASPTTARKVYRTVANGSTLKLLTTFADNTTSTFLDTTVDASLGANAPSSDTSGLGQPQGQVLAGASSIPLAGVGAFSATGGWAIIGNGTQAVRYTGLSGNTLIGIPATGPGAIQATIGYNSTCTVAPTLRGVTGVVAALQKGAPVHIWVQRDDFAAQAILAASGASDGIVEHLLSDERRGEASLTALCDADLALFSRAIVTVTYATRDLKTKSGKTVHINLPGYPVGDYVIQQVTIDQIGTAAGTAPRFTVTASSVRQSLEALLRKLVI
jgi:hypothetical protein